MTDPDEVGADLRSLVERLWTPGADPSWPVTVTYGEPAPGMTLAEEYVVAPNLRRPKVVVPVAARAASRAAFGRHLAASSLRTRATSLGLAAAFGSSVGERVVGDRLFVSIDPAIDPSDWHSWLILQHLEQTLGATGLVAFVKMRRTTPNSKPTLRLFERSGRAMGFVKIGWSPATRAVVRNEAAALKGVQDRLRLLQVPRLAAEGVWQGNDYAVAAPLPAGVRPYAVEPATTPELLQDIVRAGEVSRSSLADSGYARRIRGVLETAADEQPEPSKVLLDWLDRMVARPDELDFGRWHGDFVPWNLGRTKTGPVAWDWEYSDPDVPVGFDLVHWHFQHAIAPADGTLVPAVAAADAVADRLTTLDVASTSVDLVTSLYLLTMFTRAVRMAAEGAGWNPKIYPALLDVASTRDR